MQALRGTIFQLGSNILAIIINPQLVQLQTFTWFVTSFSFFSAPPPVDDEKSFHSVLLLNQSDDSQNTKPRSLILSHTPYYYYCSSILDSHELTVEFKHQLIC